MLEITILFVIIVLLFVLYFTYVWWGAHISMTNWATQHYSRYYYNQYSRVELRWISFEQFLKLFQENFWAVRDSFPKSFFAAEVNKDDIFTQNAIHAGYIFVDGRVYKMMPLDYLRFLIWERRTLSSAHQDRVANVRKGTVYYNEILN